MKRLQSSGVALGVVLLGLLFLLSLFRPWSIANNPGYSMYSMMTGGMFFGMGLLWILVIIFLLLGIFWLIQQLQGPGKRR